MYYIISIEKGSANTGTLLMTEKYYADSIVDELTQDIKQIMLESEEIEHEMTRIRRAQAKKRATRVTKKQRQKVDHGNDVRQKQ